MKCQRCFAVELPPGETICDGCRPVRRAGVVACLGCLRKFRSPDKARVRVCPICVKNRAQRQRDYGYSDAHIESVALSTGQRGRRRPAC